MKQINGLWFPDHEEHFQQWAVGRPYGTWTYQKSKLDAAMKFVGRRKVAVDVGGHCGLWAKELVTMFDHVHAFEPISEHRECFRLNVKRDNYTLYPYALGDKDAIVGMYTQPGSSGNSYVIPGDAVEMKRLDDFHLAPDFIKLDCEGGELYALRGGEKTLKKHRPAICVEQKPGHGKHFGLKDTAGLAYLFSLGYVLKGAISGDYFLA